jgi:hypothetical protein
MLDRQLKTALDESRLLILGAQVLFGFQFQAVFQERFADLSPSSRACLGASLTLLLTSIACLIAPSLHHQIRFQGESRIGALRAATWFAGVSLLPLTLGLGLSTFVVFALQFGVAAGVTAGAVFTTSSLLLLYGWGFFICSADRGSAMPHEEPTELKTKIEQLLTEARVIIPGGQALLGFQFIAMLTKPFAELPFAAQVVHAGGLCCVALAVTLLMTPAALHRIAFGGSDSVRFFKMASPLVIAATIPLAGGIASDIGVVFWKVTETTSIAVTAALTALTVLLALWIGYPLVRRR